MFNHQVFDWLVLCPSLVKYGEKTRPVFVFFLKCTTQFQYFNQLLWFTDRCDHFV